MTTLRRLFAELVHPNAQASLFSALLATHARRGADVDAILADPSTQGLRHHALLPRSDLTNLGPRPV